MSEDKILDTGPFYYGTKAKLKKGDFLEPQRESNYGSRHIANYLYMTATLDAAKWGAELAIGNEPGRIYQVEPTGSFENDPNLTDKRFQGNPTRSYRTKFPLRIIDEVKDWQGHSQAELERMHAHLKKLKEQGIDAINE